MNAAALSTAVGVLILVLILMIATYEVTDLKFSQTSLQTRRGISSAASMRRGSVIPIGYIPEDPSATTTPTMINNFFRGGVELPPQLRGSTFNGAMYEWDSENQTRGAVYCNIDRIDGLPNGASTITWASNRPDSLANKTTVEQVTGFGMIKNYENDDSKLCGWETGVIFMSTSTQPDVTQYDAMPFIHIYRVVLGADQKPHKMYMWEALVDDESKSLRYLQQMRLNIGDKQLFDDYNGFSPTQQETQSYAPANDENKIYFIEMFFDSSRGIATSPVDMYSNETLAFQGLFEPGTRPPM